MRPVAHHPVGATVKDPVCGMDVIPGASKGGTARHEGHDFYFCSTKCREKFEREPLKYLAPASVAGPRSETPAGVEYTCPMHPEIVRQQAGSCPICGMALEPRTLSLDDKNPELADMTRRFWVSLALTAPVFGLAMAEMIPGEPVQHALGIKPIVWIQLALATPVVFWGGWPLLQRGWASLMTRSLNMFTLIALGIGVAYGYSLVAALAPGIFPSAFRGHGGQVSVYFEAAGVITVLVLLGQVLELRARSSTSSAIKALLGLAPKTARLVGDTGRRTTSRSSR